MRLIRNSQYQTKYLTVKHLETVAQGYLQLHLGVSILNCNHLDHNGYAFSACVLTHFMNVIIKKSCWCHETGPCLKFTLVKILQ